MLELASKPPAPVEEVKKPRVVAARPAPVEEEKPKRVTSDDGDKVPWAERALACAPYLLPLSDALPFGNYVFNDFPALVTTARQRPNAVEIPSNFEREREREKKSGVVDESRERRAYLHLSKELERNFAARRWLSLESAQSRSWPNQREETG